MSFDYIDLGYVPSGNDIVCTFRVEPCSKSAANNIALESSVGTWIKVNVKNRLMAKVFSIKGSIIKIAYPLELFELGNIPQLLSSVAGNVFGMNAVNKLILENIDFPDKYIKCFTGPKFGLSGVREEVGVLDRPLVGTIVKPKLGLSPKEHAKVAFDSWVGGLDIVKDDENLTSQTFNSFEDRLIETLRARDSAEDETGESKIYVANITAPFSQMVERGELVQEYGGNCVMIDVFTSGFSAIQSFRNLNLNLIIHAHRAMHAAMTRSSDFGISMLVFSKLFRLAGVDQLHTGTVIGKMHGEKSSVLEINAFLRSNWLLKPVLPIASGGLHPCMIPELIKLLGRDVILQFGGGVHAHPDGTMAGARSVRQAMDAVMSGYSLKQYSKQHIELARALEFFSSENSH